MRLIDADALKYKQQVMYKKDDSDDVWAEWFTTATEINNAPTIDAVPVVRCKDCIYYQDNNDGYPNADCKWCKDETPDANDYCSCGERKDDED